MWAAGSFEVSTVVVACLLGVVPTFVVALCLEIQLPAVVVATHLQVYLPSTSQPDATYTSKNRWDATAGETSKTIVGTLPRT